LTGGSLHLFPQGQFRRWRTGADQHHGAQALAVLRAVTLAVACCPAGFVEQFGGAGRVIVLAVFEVAAVERRGDAKRATGAGEFAEVHALERAFDIGAAHEGLAHADVIEGCAAQIERAVGGVARALGDDQVYVRVAPRRFMRLGRQRFDHVDLTGLQ